MVPILNKLLLLTPFVVQMYYNQCLGWFCWDTISGKSSDSPFIVISSVVKERADSNGGGRDGGTRRPECSAPLGGDEWVHLWSSPSGSRALGDPVPTEPWQYWTATGKDRTITIVQSHRNWWQYHWCYYSETLFQGYLHMWIDMFPTDIPAPPPVNIKPRLPVQ